MLNKQSITVREVNRYLSPLIDKLLEKHKKVSNPDFEQELLEIAGIGWKQVKNYRNHPNPKQKINGNSKIQPFIYYQRKTDFIFKAKTYLIYSTITLIFISSIIIFITNLLNKKEPPKYISLEQAIQSKGKILFTKNIIQFSFEFPQSNTQIRIGYIEDILLYLQQFKCKHIHANKYICTKELSAKSNLKIQVDSNIITEANLIINDQHLSEQAMTSLQKRFKFLIKDESIQNEYQITKFLGQKIGAEQQKLTNSKTTLLRIFLL